MPALTIELTASVDWHDAARRALTGWPPSISIDLQPVGVTWPAELSDDSVLVQALASESSPTNLAPFSSRPGSAHATIVGPQPMSVESFSAWAQRALLGTANPAIDDVLAWTLPHRVTELDLPTDARASHHARTAMRSIADGLSCVDDVLLATSELTANALQHGGGSPRLTALRTDHSVTVALTDRRPDALPSVLGMRGAVASSGRGMAIVEAISTYWGVTVYHDHKVVWCELTGH